MELVDSDHIYMSGNVVIHPTAAIAPGVMLQADPHSQLLIAAGVCIGSGSILHAHRGRLEIESGVTLGSGVLVVGQGKIGAHACVGAKATIMDSSIAPHQSIPPGALIGDISRQIATSPSLASPPVSAPPAQAVESQADAPPGDAALPDPWDSLGSSAPAPEREAPTPDSVADHLPIAPVPPAPAPDAPGAQPLPAPPPPPQIPPPIYGQAYLERMMIALFPHRQAAAAKESTAETEQSS